VALTRDQFQYATGTGSIRHSRAALAKLTHHHVAPSNQHEHDDLVIVSLALDDPRAFSPLYDRYFTLVNNYCLRRLHHAENAADATSQIFINAIQSLSKFKPDPQRPGSSFRSWLFAIAHNVVIDHYRRSRPQLSFDNEEGEALHLPDPDLTPEEHSLANELQDHLSTLLNELPERQAIVAECRLAGFTNAEIAASLQISATAVRAAQHRAFVALRPLLGPRSGDNGDRS
jgi:RNA polymerase sigma-70 factor (ECF subfamily)